MHAAVLQILNQKRSPIYVHFNDGKPWWKKRRTIFYIESRRYLVFDLSVANNTMNIDKLYIRWGEKGRLHKLIELPKRYWSVMQDFSAASSTSN
jgi:hypothetical protein